LRACGFFGSFVMSHPWQDSAAVAKCEQQVFRDASSLILS
jgi:hypothetical protein